MVELVGVDGCRVICAIVKRKTLSEDLDKFYSIQAENCRLYGIKKYLI